MKGLQGPRKHVFVFPDPKVGDMSYFLTLSRPSLRFMLNKYVSAFLSKKIRSRREGATATIFKETAQTAANVLKEVRPVPV